MLVFFAIFWKPATFLSGISGGPLGRNLPKNSSTSIELHLLCISSAIADIVASRIKCREVNGVGIWQSGIMPKMLIKEEEVGNV